MIENNVAVDIHQLDYEWERQASLYLKASQDYANALSDRDHKKFQLDIVMADLDTTIRSNPSKFGMDKITEAAIKACVLKHKSYKLAQDDLTDANLEVNMLVAYKSALEHKKKALEKLTDLYLSGYWAEPKIKAEVKEEISKTNSQKMSEGLRNNARIQERQKLRRQQNGSS